MNLGSAVPGEGFLDHRPPAPGGSLSCQPTLDVLTGCSEQACYRSRRRQHADHGSAKDGKSIFGRNQPLGDALLLDSWFREAISPLIRPF